MTNQENKDPINRRELLKLFGFAGLAGLLFTPKPASASSIIKSKRQTPELKKKTLLSRVSGFKTVGKRY